MTFSPKAIEAACEAFMDTNDLLGKQMEAALSAALAVDGVELVEIGSLSEHKFGLEWFERVFQVPLGDKPGALKVDEIRAMLAAASDREERR